MKANLAPVAASTLMMILPGCAAFVSPLSITADRVSPLPMTVDRPTFAPLRSNGRQTRTELSLSNKWNRDWEEKGKKAAQRAASTPGAGETAAGAILGGLVLGPFGALFGAQLGSSVGRVRAAEQAKNDEMKRKGITPEMLAMAEECGVALERAIEGLKATRDSLETQQAYARRLDREVERVYDEAKVAMAASDEDKARSLLMDRQTQMDRLKKALQLCADEKRRLATMEDNVKAIEDRAMEVDRMLRRAVGAKALQETSTGLSLDAEDPLLQKFRDLERMD